MANIEIKQETLPQRCDICHQADCFDPASNHCSRCAPSVGLIKPQSNLANAQGKVTIDLQLTLDEFSQAENSLTSHTSAGKQILFWIIIIGASLFLYTTFRSAPDAPVTPPPDDTGPTNVWLTLLLTFAPILLLVSFFLFWWLHAKKKNAAFIKNEYANMRCTFSSDGYELSNDKLYTQTKWQLITKAAESETHFVFYSDSLIRLVVPKRLFNNQHDIVILRDFIKSSLGEKAQLLAVNSSN